MPHIIFVGSSQVRTEQDVDISVNFDNTTVNSSRNASALDPMVSHAYRQWCLLPTVVILGMLALAGILGNTLTAWVYARPLRGTVNARLLTVLAALDITICVVCIPMEMYDLMVFLVPPPVCKVMRFVVTSLEAFSTILVVLVAVDRYLRLCHPFHNIRFTRCVGRIMLIAAVASAAVAAPRLQFSRLYERRDGITMCVTVSERTSPWALSLYMAIVGLLYLSSAVIIFALYWQIHRHLRRHTRSMTAADVRATSYISYARVTRISFLVTVVYFVSFLPYVLEMIVVPALDFPVWELTDWPLTLESLVTRSFFVNSAVNPLIYSMVSKKFRHHSALVICRCCKRSGK